MDRKNLAFAERIPSLTLGAGGDMVSRVPQFSCSCWDDALSWVTPKKIDIAWLRTTNYSVESFFDSAAFNLEKAADPPAPAYLTGLRYKLNKQNTLRSISVPTESPQYTTPHVE